MQDGAVKYATAVRHLVEMANVASENRRLRDSAIGWPLEELWVAGELLDGPESLEAGSVVLVLDVPPDELTWLAKHPSGEWVGSQLRLGKRPFFWAYRPLVRPVWNHRHRRVARFWSAEQGPHADMLESLAERRLDHLPIVEPTAEDLVQQLSEELTAGRRHLCGILDRYWDYDWRRDHRGQDESPEDHLWRAAQAVSEMEAALSDLDK